MQTITFTSNNSQQEKNILGFAMTYCGASIISMSLFTLTLSLPNPATLTGVRKEETTQYINRFTKMLSNNNISYTVSTNA